MNKIIVITAALLLFGCASNQLNIPQELTPSEIIQRAQEASDKNRYNHALQYYQALLDRNPTNIDLVCAAEYEIAFVRYKQKKYALAKEGFHALLERYDVFDEGYLPPQYKLLALKVLEQITEKEKPRSLFSRKG